MTTEKYDEQGAFGNPDGSREDFNRFVSLKSEGLSQSNPTYVDSSISHRVIVGAKGSGKTIYLRKMKLDAENNESIAVIKDSNQLPSTDSILSIHKMYGDKIRTEQWEIIWRRSIFLSVASQFYCQHTRHDKIKTTLKIDRGAFLSIFSNLISSRYITPQSIFSQVSAIIMVRGQSYNRLKDYLEDPEWDSFETIIGELIKNAPPIVYFIDALDEELRHAPAAWLDFQKGLFYQVMRLLRDSELGNRLHIIICIRDLVLSSVLQSEHAGRYVNDEHIKVLHWSRGTAKEFFAKKIEMLKWDYFINKNQPKTLKNLVGYKTIRNTKRAIREDLEDYILRHTKYFPRDIINMGNVICQEIESTRGNRSIISPLALSKSISLISSIIARETLAVCGNNLAASSLPNYAIKVEILELYIGNKIVADSLKDILFSFIRKIGSDHFNRTTLESALTEFQELFEENAERDKFEQYRIDTVLWQHGLIGYKNRVRDKLSRFKNSSPLEPYSLPSDKPCYVLHSCIYDAVKISFKRGRPVVCE